MTLTEAQTTLAAIEAALADGVLTVEKSDRRLTFHTINDMRAYANQLRRDIQRASGRREERVAVWSGSK